MRGIKTHIFAICKLVLIAVAAFALGGSTVRAEEPVGTAGYYRPYEGANYQLVYVVREEGVSIYGWNGDGDITTETYGDLIIPDKINGMPVVRIDEYAFSKSGFTGRAVIPDSITDIGDYAFRMSKITGELVIPESVTKIGKGVFEYCWYLTGVTIPDSVTSIGENAFYDCSGLSGELNIPDSVISIGEGAFFGCSGFAGELNIPDSVTTIGGGAFYNCSGFTGKLNIPDSVTTIGVGAFSACSGFTGVSIPDSITEISDNTFCDCSGFMGELNIPDSVTVIGDGAFCRCSGFTGELNIPDSVTAIGDAAFRECSGFTGEWKIPDGINTIGNAAFYGCSGFTGELKIPDGVTIIDDYAFKDCTGFTGLSIPGGVTYIGDSAFMSCWNLAGDLIIPDSVTSIGELAFFWCNGFTGLKLSESLTTIGTRAFEECIGFTGDLVIPDSVIAIGDRAFQYCSGFTGLKLSNCLTTVGEEAFSACGGLEGELVIPNSVTQIGNGAFAWCGFEGLTILGVPAAVEANSFEGWENIAEVKYGYKPCTLEILAQFPEGIAVYYPSYVDGWGEVLAANPDVNWIQYESPVVPFVKRMYEVALNRVSDESGLKYWVNDLLSGNQTGAEVAYSFIFSEEFKKKNYCNEHYIMQLYKAFMGREYDEEGLNYWLHQLETGAIRETVFNGFSQSAEFKGICDSFGIRLGDPVEEPQYGTVPMGACSVDGREDGVTSFVKRLYNICLDREAEAEGLDYWTKQLWARECSGMTAAYGFVFSDEFKNKNHSDADYVEYLYEAFMDRSSDEDGKAYWLGSMADEGLTRENVFDGFARSLEFERICSKFGIVAY